MRVKALSVLPPTELFVIDFGHSKCLGKYVYLGITWFTTDFLS